MHNPKSIAPLVIIVKSVKDNCDTLREEIRELAPSVRVGTIDYVNIHCTMKTMLERKTPIVGIIHFNPKPYGHVDTVPSGVAHLFMNMAKGFATHAKPQYAPHYILYTDAEPEVVNHMSRPISPASTIPPDKIHIVRSDAQNAATAIVNILTAHP